MTQSLQKNCKAYRISGETCSTFDDDADGVCDDNDNDDDDGEDDDDGVEDGE